MKVLPGFVAFVCLFTTMALFTPQLSAQQRDETTITGCLTPGDRAGFYTLREEGTGFTITVTGLADLQQASANHKVRLTGRAVRERGQDLFRVTRVEDLAPTCEPTFPLFVSREGISQAVGRARYGVNGGVGLDPELIYLGAQGQFGPVFGNVWFRPNFEFGFGEVTKRVSLNLDAVYYLPLLARGAGTRQQDVWSIYMGAGPAIQLSHRNFEEGDVNIDFGDWSYDTGLNVVIGVSQRSGLFTELKAGVYGAPALRIIVGYNFR